MLLPLIFDSIAIFENLFDSASYKRAGFSFIRACEESILSIVMSHKTSTHTYLITATDTAEKELKELSVIVIINDEIFICLAMGVYPICFCGSQVLHKYDKIFLFPS